MFPQEKMNLQRPSGSPVVTPFPHVLIPGGGFLRSGPSLWSRVSSGAGGCSAPCWEHRLILGGSAHLPVTISSRASLGDTTSVVPIPPESSSMQCDGGKAVLAGPGALRSHPSPSHPSQTPLSFYFPLFPPFFLEESDPAATRSGIAVPAGGTTAFLSLILKEQAGGRERPVPRGASFFPELSTVIQRLLFPCTTRYQQPAAGPGAG